MHDYNIIKVDEASGNLIDFKKFERPQEDAIFPFQLPIVGDPYIRSVITIDWSKMQLH